LESVELVVVNAEVGVDLVVVWALVNLTQRLLFTRRPAKSQLIVGGFEESQVVTDWEGPG
jgi:hypothetical protein